MLQTALALLPAAGGRPAYWGITILAAAGVCALTVLVMRGRKK